VHELFRDFRFAARRLFKDRGYAVTAILTLALCIGANTAIFSVVDAVVLQPLPFDQPERLVRMFNSYPNAGAERGSNSAPDFYDRRALTEVFEEVAEFQGTGASMELDGVPQQVSGWNVTPSFFNVLRVEPEMGRAFTEAEGEIGAEDVVILSHGLWQQLYGDDRTVIGRTLRLSGEPATIVGVMGEGFVFLNPDVRMWRPQRFTEEQRQEYHSNSWNMIARLQPGVTLEQAQQRIDALNEANLDKTPALRQAVIDAGYHTPVMFLQQDMVRNVRATLFLLWGGVGFVLLIGCVNLANLVMVRSSARAKDLATRLALGAGRWQVTRQALAESLITAAVGGTLGVLFAWAGLRGMGAMGFDDLPRASEVSLDASALAWTAGLAALIGLLLGLIPMVAVFRTRLTAAFRDDDRAGTAGRRSRLLRDGLVVVQTAFALILLVGAGLLLASFRQVLAVDPGFEPQGVLSATASPPSSRYENRAALFTFADELLAAVRALPGVEAAGLTSSIPFAGNYSDSVILAEGYVPAPGESLISPDRTQVSAGYFETMQIPLIRGRTFNETDLEDSQPVIVIDQKLADKFWPDGDALGKRMFRPDNVEEILDPTGATMLTVVGIVGGVRRQTLEDLGEIDVGAYYLPMKQNAFRTMGLVVRTAGDPNAQVAPLRRIVAEIDPELPLFGVATMQERIDDSLRGRQSPMFLALVFAGLALFLAAVGIYGVLAYLVSLRTREIGIRMALGSNRGDIFRLVLREGVAIIATGFVLGLIGAVALQRAIESQLFGVSVLQPGVLAAVLAVLAAVGLAACAIPAQRATRIDPVSALSGE
jgi:predicted permease